MAKRYLRLTNKLYATAYTLVAATAASKFVASTAWVAYAAATFALAGFVFWVGYRLDKADADDADAGAQRKPRPKRLKQPRPPELP